MQFTFSDLLVISLISAMIPVILFLEIELRILFCVFFEKKKELGLPQLSPYWC